MADDLSSLKDEYEQALAQRDYLSTRDEVEAYTAVVRDLEPTVQLETRCRWLRFAVRVRGLLMGILAVGGAGCWSVGLVWVAISMIPTFAISAYLWRRDARALARTQRLLEGRKIPPARLLT